MKKIFILFILNYTLLIVNSFPQTGWQIVQSGTNADLNSAFFFDYEVGYACGDSGTVIKSIDSGKTWQSVQTPVTNDLNDLYVFNDSTLCVVGDSGTIIFSLDAGNNWYIGSYFLTEDYYSLSFSGVNGTLGGSSQTIVRAEFGGTQITFYGVQSGFFGGGFWATSMLSPEIGFIAGENSIFQPLFGKTTDSGINWDFTAFYINNNEGRATGVDFTDTNTGYISARVWDGHGAISKTTDGGNTWTSILFTYPLWSIDFPISNSSLIGYAVGDEGVILKTYNAGMDWSPQQSGTNNKLNKVYFKDLDFGFAVGANGIILRTESGGEPVTIVENQNHLSNNFQLFQNFPNPFNPSTRISWQSPISGHLILKIYDILGNEVATLVDEYKQAGEYSVEFDSNSGVANVGRRSIPSGVYFYKLKVGEFSRSKKMILLK
jgi:photosystem II stability/assembly factor-like uncharacterized protein